MNTLTLSSFAVLSFASALVLNAGASTGEFRLDERTLHGESTFQWKDIDALLSIDENADGTLTEAELQASKPLLVEFGEMLYSVKQAGVSTASLQTNVALSPEGQIVFDLTFPLPGGARSDELELEFAGAADFPLTHQHAFRVSDADGKVLVDDISDRSNERPVFPEPGKEIQAILAAADSSSTMNADPAPKTQKLPQVQISDPAPSPSRFLTGLWICLALLAGWCGNVVATKIRK
ncbi:MAG: hypothetical protein R3F19_16370 [Verrucomicrobiales bacterium]